MSTQTILAGIGYAVGSYFGYPQLGAIVGSLVGAALAPTTKTTGPRLDDQKVTVSTYGAGIPTVYGNVRVGGNVVDSTDKIEVGSTTSQGKGGGTSNTSYKYFVHMAVALCATPSDGSLVTIRRLWKDGKLIYDASSGIPVASALASATSPYSFLVLYQGAETQLPDPLEELQHGIGNVPAYRGIVRVRLNAVECPGGRVPQFSFEICVGGTTRVLKSTISAGPTELDAYQQMGGFVQPDGTAIHYRVPIYGNPDRSRFETYAVGPGYAQHTGTFFAPVPGTTITEFLPIVGGTPAFVQLYFATTGDRTANLISVRRVDAVTGQLTPIGTFTPSADTIFAFRGVAYDESTDTYVLAPSVGAASSGCITFRNGSANVLPVPPNGYGPIAAYGGMVHMLNGACTAVTALDQTTGSVIDTQVLPGAITLLNPDGRLRAGANGVYALCIGTGGGSTQGLWKRGATSYTLVSSDVLILDPSSGLGATPDDLRAYQTFYTDGNVLIVGPALRSGAVYSYDLIRLAVVMASQPTVQSILQDQCVRAGLTLAQIDTSTINDTVSGMTLTNPASARSNIAPLMTAFAIDATEESGVIRFFHRAAGTSVATLAYAELAAIEDGGTPGDPMPLARMQEADVPRSVAVSYINKDFDYQTSTEKANRQTTVSKLDQTIDLPLSVGADIAATVAQRVLIDAWNERNHRTFKVSRKYAFVSAGDVVTITFQDGTLIDWRLTKVTDTGVLLEWEGVPANGAIYAQVVTGSAGYVPQQIPALTSPTGQQLLDIPLLRDKDDGAGIYDALSSYGLVWTGAELFVGDVLSNVSSQGIVSTMAPIGFAETVLPSALSSQIDAANLLTVNIGAATFNSCTRDVLLAGGGEYWAYGKPGSWEIGASSTANSLGSGRYTLSNHLRGLFGTERNTGTHAVGDTFVLLRPAGLLRVNMSVGELGQAKVYLPVSAGQLADNAQPTKYVNTGEGLKPLSPINLRRSMLGNDITLTWDRRSRLSMNNSTGTLPLGETTEHYSVEFWTSGAYATLAGTLTTTTAGLTITSAQQTAFGLIPGTAVFVRVRQYSDSVGVGHELQATA